MTDTLAVSRQTSAPAESAPPAPTSNGAAKPIFLTRDELLRKRLPRTKDVEVAGWGTARVRQLVQREADELAAYGKQKDGTRDNRGVQALAVAMALVGQDNAPLFDNPTDGAISIGELPIPVVNALFSAVAELSLLTVEAEAEAGKGSAPTGAGKR